MIKITKKVISKIIEHALKDAPVEACGYLAGKEGEVTEAISMSNIDESPEHYSFSPDEQFKVLKDTRNRGVSLLAVYHSHPATPARMSAEDIKLAYDTNISYVIVSLANNDANIKSFRIENKKAIEEELEII